MTIAHTPQGDIEYRIEGEGSRVALVLYGGHTNIYTHLGEDYFLERGYKILVVSRPGYGRTPLSAGLTPDVFADTLAGLLKQLTITKVLVVGISAGGRTAIRFAARHSQMTDRLILQSSISFAPWPGRLTRLGSRIGFNSLTGKYTWGVIHFLVRLKPKLAIKLMVGNLTTLSPRKVVDGFSKQQFKDLCDLFMHMGSGQGFLNDIKTVNNDAADVTAPTLIIHSKYDKSVPLNHPLLLAKQIKNSQLYLSEAESHLIWFSSHYRDIEKTMDEFSSAAYRSSAAK
jgi:pimeloyl-ACP methyl ester carboxylesterase